MTGAILHALAGKYVRPLPQIAPGYTVRVHERVREGEKERVQMFEGLVIAVHRGHSPTDRTFTVRRVASGVGVERVFPLQSPVIAKIDVKKVAKVRRAKLSFLRGRRGKSARLSERFTTAEEFAVAVAEPEAVEKEAAEEIVETKNEETPHQAAAAANAGKARE